MRKKVLPALLALVLLLSIVPVSFAANANPYKDVSTEDWFYPAVEYMSGKKYMTGYSDTEFAPNDTLSRAMFVTVLYRISGEKVQTSETKFTDVPQNTWYSEAVAWAVENGITGGTGDTTFSPDDPVTREQMATFLKRYADSKGIFFSDRYVAGEPDDFSDCNSWGRSGTLYAYEFGLLFATNGKVYPTNNATRADAAAAFYNLLCKNASVTPDGNICDHNWATRHIDEVGHYESIGTHTVRIEWCSCGVHFRLGNPDDEARRRAHYDPFGDTWGHFSMVETREEPNDPQYVVDTPAHDETYCTICGITQ